MRIDLAKAIKVGDTLYNCFMDPMVVTSIYKDNNNIIFSTIDTKLYRRGYSYEDIYFSDLYGESDEEKSWINWIKNNRDTLDTFDDIENSKKMYKIGFANGFQYKHQISIEEMLQK